MTRIEVRNRQLRPTTLIVVALGTTLFALGAWAFGPVGHGRHHGEFHEFMLNKLLDRADASDEQRLQITAIMQAAHADVESLRNDTREQMHEDALRILTAETVDRAALDALHAEHLQMMDQSSARMIDALVESANVLSQAQRVLVADAMREHMEERRERHHDGPL